MKPITSGAPKRARIHRSPSAYHPSVRGTGYKELPDPFEFSPVRKQGSPGNPEALSYANRRKRTGNTKKEFSVVDYLAGMRVGETKQLPFPSDQLLQVKRIHRRVYPNAICHFYPNKNGGITAKCLKV